jgi:SSS family solute:Na+ symporter
VIYLILLYCVLQVALGLWIGRRVRTSGDFFVAGRTLSGPLLFATLLAANVGAGSTIGATGLGYRDGLAAWWWVGSAGIGSFFLAQFVGPKIWKIAAEHDLRTAGDFLEWRYGRDVRGVISALLWIGSISILSGQLIAMASILNVVAGIDKAWGAVIGGVVATMYFTSGGLLTSAYVNVVQLAVKITGFAIAVPFLVGAVGGLDALRAAPSIPAASWDFFGGGSPSGIQYIALLGPAFVISPGLLQKVYGARDEKAVRWGVTANSLALFAFACLPPLVGLCAKALHPALANHELALPTVLTNDMPHLLGALGLAAVVSAELSTADAVLFILATSLSKDLYKTVINPEASDQQVLKVARLAAVAGGALGTLVAIYASTVIGVLSLFYSLLGVSLFVPVLFGLYAPRAGRPQAYAAIFTGVTVLLIARFATGGGGYFGFAPPTLGLFASLIAGFAALLLAPSSNSKSTGAPA